jgi:predicted Zn-dependent peptidase
MTVKTYTFPNGFRMVYEKSPGNIPVTYVRTFCDFGSADEPSDAKGSAHFIEHMCFKGTKSIKDSIQLTETYDKIGAYMNALTNKLFTCYIVKCDSHYLESMVNLVSDMMLNSVFQEKECIKEEQVVIEENSKNGDDSSDIVFVELDKLMYKGSVYELPIDNTSYHTKQLTCDRMHEIHKMRYQPNRMVISIVSNLSFVHVMHIVASSLFTKAKNRVMCDHTLDLYLPPQTEPRIKIIEKKSEVTTHLAIGFRVDEADRYKLILLKTIVGGPMSGRLFSILREQNGLTYHSSASVSMYVNYGDMTFYAESDSKKMMQNGKGKKGVFPLIIDMLRDLGQNGVNEKEVIMAKHNLEGTINTSLDDNELRCIHNGTSELLYPDRTICPYNNLYTKHYKNITMGEINQVARKYLNRRNTSVCFSGGNPPKLPEVQRLCELIGD